MSYDITQKIKVTNPASNIDWYYGGENGYWANLSAAKAGVPEGVRQIGKTVAVNMSQTDTPSSVEFWWKDGIEDEDLVQKITDVSTISPMVFMGTVGTGGTITWSNFPAADYANTGHTYKVITNHTGTNPKCKVGDTVISTGTEWQVIPSGDEPTYSTVSTTSAGLAPAITSTSGYLKGDGTWSTPDTSVTATTSGSGNAVTSVTASGNAITVTKGTTFLTGAASSTNLGGIKIVTQATVPSTYAANTLYLITG